MIDIHKCNLTVILIVHAKRAMQLSPKVQETSEAAAIVDRWELKP
jgi:hypothetical protein